MPRATTNQFRTTGHVRVPAATIGALSMILAAGLEMLGFLNRLNGEIARAADDVAKEESLRDQLVHERRKILAELEEKKARVREGPAR